MRDESGATTIALTLLRSVGWLSRDDLLTRKGNAGPMVAAPSAQCQGQYEFEHVLMSHSGDWRAITQEARQVNRPLLLARADWHEGFEQDALRILDTTSYEPLPGQFLEPSQTGELDAKMSFVANQRPELLLTALKKSERSTGFIVRFHNTSADTIKDRLSFVLRLQKAYVTNRNDERRQPLSVASNEATDGEIACNEVEFEVRGNSVVTLEVVF